MEAIVAVFLGIWLCLGGVVSYVKVTKDFKEYSKMKKEEK